MGHLVKFEDCQIKNDLKTISSTTMDNSLTIDCVLSLLTVKQLQEFRRRTNPKYNIIHILRDSDNWQVSTEKEVWTDAELIKNMVELMSFYLYYPDDDPNQTIREYINYTYVKSPISNDWHLSPTDEKIGPQDCFYVCHCEDTPGEHEQNRSIVSTRDAARHFMHTGHYETYWSSLFITDLTTK